MDELRRGQCYCVLVDRIVWQTVETNYEGDNPGCIENAKSMMVRWNNILGNGGLCEPTPLVKRKVTSW